MQLLRNANRRVGECVDERLRIANLQAQLSFFIINSDIVAQSEATEPSNFANGADRYRAFQSVDLRQEHKVERKPGDDRKRLACDSDEQTIAGPTS